MKKYTVLFIFALCLTGFSTQAQIKLNHISGGLAYWNRSYSDADERAFLPNYTEDDGFTKSGIMPFVGAELNLIGSLALEGRVGIWSGTFDGTSVYGNGLTISEEMKQTIIPVSLGLSLQPNWFGGNISPFFGVGLNRYFIQNKISRNVTGGTGEDFSETFSGNSYGAYYKAGLELMLSDHLGVALHGRYNTGSYDQVFVPEEGTSAQTYEVSLKGLEVGLSLRYKFDVEDRDEVAPDEDEEEE